MYRRNVCIWPLLPLQQPDAAISPRSRPDTGEEGHAGMRPAVRLPRRSVFCPSGSGAKKSILRNSRQRVARV